VARPNVDVVVPFRGQRRELDQLRGRLASLALAEGDSLRVVDNTPGASSLDGAVPVTPAAELGTPAYARNRGAALGQAEWILFFDADTIPPPDLLERLFDPLPAERTGLLAGGVRDEPVPRGGPPAARFAYLRRAMSQDHTFSFGRWSFAQTAHAAVRRAAFEAVGGFRAQLRAGEDADLTYRLQGAGWGGASTPPWCTAAARPCARSSARGWAMAQARLGSTASTRARSRGTAAPALVWWGVRFAVTGVARAVRDRDRDAALWAVFEPLSLISRELGRSLSNERTL